jgi:hypothetical protein
MTVTTHEFLRRFFLIHVLPRGLVRIRHFGLFANRNRRAGLARCRSLMPYATVTEAIATVMITSAEMAFIPSNTLQRLPKYERRTRAPPGDDRWSRN